MRVPSFLKTIPLLLLAATALQAQDLQYRMTMQSTMPGMPMTMPPTVMTVSVKGSVMRMDMALPGTDESMTTVMDVPGKKILMLRHSDKVYREMPYEAPWQKVDSLTMSKWNDWKPVVKETGEKKQIQGYTARRIIQSADMRSFPQMPGMEALREDQKLVMVSEHWVADDPKLIAAYTAFTKAMNRGEPDPFTIAMMGQSKPGFPLSMTIMMLHVPENKPYDAEAILKAGDKAEGLKMRTTMTADAIKLTPLDASFFKAPKDYTKE